MARIGPVSAPNKTQATEASVAEFLQRYPSRVREDCEQLIGIMSRITGCEPVMWGPTIIGFDTYHYTYASGREGDSAALALAPRQGKVVVYLDSSARHAERIATLPTAPGVKGTTGKVCLYLPALAGIDLVVLEQILVDAYAYVKALDGRVPRAE